VIQIGSTTCGKPYGFYPQDNCGTTYFSIEFQGDNAMGFGNYPDGFSPQNSASLTSAVLPGCSVADDFGHELGDPAEGRLAAALGYRSGQGCPSPPSGVAPLVPAIAAQAPVHREFWRENRILRH
jgi:carboxyl-terminal processing protease